MTTRNKKLGAWGEGAAAEYLINQGYEMIGRNVRTPYGEIDLIAEKEGLLVFVEVKTRTSIQYGLPEEAITEHKQIKMIESAQSYLEENDLEVDWQLDVIAIRKISDKQPEIHHIENVLS